VVFITEGGQEDVHRPHDPQTGAPLRFLNLPSRQWVVQQAAGSFPIEDEAAAERLAQYKSVKFSAYMPSGRPFESTIVESPLHQ
jgi:hypothetical protein